MKYEMIFGDERLFDGYYDENVFIVIATSDGRKFVIGEFTEYGIVDCDIKSDGLRIAMRRIIKEPKRWTWEDKKAGVLPEVGCKVLNTDMSISRCVLCEVIHVNADVVIVYNGELSQTYPHAAFVCAFNPSETPEEMEQREQEEFVASFNSEKYSNPTLYREGLRDAYR